MRSHSTWQPNPEQPKARPPRASHKRQAQFVTRIFRRCGVTLDPDNALYMVKNGWLEDVPQ